MKNTALPVYLFALVLLFTAATAAPATGGFLQEESTPHDVLQPPPEWTIEDFPRIRHLSDHSLLLLNSIIHNIQNRDTKRANGPSLSIVNPLEVLKERVRMELARRQREQSMSRIAANTSLLKNIGKRSVASSAHTASVAD